MGLIKFTVNLVRTCTQIVITIFSTFLQTSPGLSLLNLSFRLFRFIADWGAKIVSLHRRPQIGKIPVVTQPMLLESASDLVAKIRQGKVKSANLVRAYIERIKEVQPYINAVVDERFKDAIQEAMELDIAIQYELQHGKPWDGQRSIHQRPLLGIPFTCKDSIAVRGLAFTSGSLTRKGIKADVDSSVIRNLREAGAIPLALSNICEFTLFWDSYSKLYGRTNNPYDLSRIPGGSSGGEGALIGSAASLIGVGSDSGGSVRVPAAFCGVWGHKVTSGIVPVEGQFPPMDDEVELGRCVGPLVRYSNDIIPALKAMAGDAADRLDLDSQVNLKKIKLYYLLDDRCPLNTRVKPVIKNRIQGVAKHFSDKYQIKTEELYLPGFATGYFMSQFRWIQVSGPVIAITNSLSASLLELVKHFLGLSNYTLTTIMFDLYARCWLSAESRFAREHIAAAEALKAELLRILGNNSVLLLPSYPESPPKHNTVFVNDSNFTYTAIFNAPLAFPATACPLGLTRNNHPFGLQVVATPYNDKLTIAVAREIEESFGGWIPPHKSK